MYNMTKLILLSLFLASCSQAVSSAPQNYLGEGVSRFETADAICYTYYRHSISCIAKGKK